MRISPCAKINLGLNIINKRPDGYHDLQTVFYPINIRDGIEMIVADGASGSCSLEVNGNVIEGEPEKNLVVRAYRLIAEDYALPHVRIILDKRIPMQAGLGGGSSDCAYTIRLLNDMFDLGMSTETMQGYAARLGADSAFFITAQPAYAEGIGERLSPIPLNLDKYHIAVVKPPIAVSTKEAFANIVVANPERCCRDIVQQPLETWRDELRNDFEASIFPQYPILADIKKELYSRGAIYAAMSGSGSSIFGLFHNPPTLDFGNDCQVFSIPCRME